MSWLKTIGKVFFGIQNVAIAALPVVAEINPGIAAAMCLTLKTVVATEQHYAAIGKQDGTGAQKLASAINVSGEAVGALLAQAGVKINALQKAAFYSKIVEAFNTLPAPENFTKMPDAVPNANGVLAAGAGQTS